MRKNVVFFWSKEHQDKFLSDTYKYPTFRRFANKANEYFNYFLAFGPETHKGYGVFTPVFKFFNNQLIPYEKEVIANIVLKYDIELEGNKGKVIFLYTPEFNEFCKSKIDTYRYLANFTSKAFYCDSENTYIAQTSKISTDKFVIKPNRGVCGRAVHVLNKSDHKIPQDLLEVLHEGVVIQEFIDTSNGYPGIAHSTHDLRLSMINDQNIVANVSVPPEGSLVANWHRGATSTEIEVEKLPQIVKDFRDKVHRKIKSKYKKVMYNMDIGITPEGPRLFELNSPIAFPRPDWKSTDLYISNLIEYINSL